MITHKNSNTNSQSSDSALTPNWRPPKAPLPPHRLAKLANALGVATPVPASHSGLLISRSHPDSPSSADPYRRSPTPSTAASTAFSTNIPTTSKFLLHVLPPLSFPYDPDNLDDTDLLPPPSAASGYHTQFRRGILVPVHSSFQSQLSAIAKEYALPSTAGLILYLITTASSQPPSAFSLTGTIPDDVVEEPGPRLSDEIWRHIWARVIQVEQRDATLPPRSTTPGLVSLRTGLASRSTPHLLDTAPSSLRPITSASTAENFPLLTNGTSPSTPSSASDPRSNSKSAADSSQDDPETPDTSAASNAFDPQQRAHSFDLPGLHSPSLIPILAKVEFDIDRRKAVWYEPWLRNRKANHAKRVESRLGRKISTNEEGAGGQDRNLPIQLIIGRQQTASPISIFTPSGDGNPAMSVEEHASKPLKRVGDKDYQQLSDEDEDSDSDDGGADDEEETARVTTISGKDPLADVFGTDADVWAEIRASSGGKRSSDLNVVNLALTAADLNGLPEDSLQEPDSLVQPEEEEVRELLEQMSRPNSRSTIPNDNPLSPQSKRSSSSTHTAKRHVPPPLVLVPKDGVPDLVVPSEPSPLPSSAGSVGLAYLNGDSSPEKFSMPGYTEGQEPEEFDDRYTRVRSPAESEKRAGTFYDELNLGLDPSEDFDENDPNDRRRSQFLLKAQLDEIERTMAQLSPRMLNPELESDTFASISLSPKTQNPTSLSPKSGIINADYYPPSPSPRAPKDSDRSPTLIHPDLVHGPPRTSSANVSAGANQAAWPAVPFSSIQDSQGLGNSSQIDGPPSPPKLALNGVTTSAPKSFVPALSNAVSAETERRKRELEEEYPALAKSSSPMPEPAAESPVIPLSPDPFGRYPSSTSIESTINGRMSNSSLHQWDSVTLGRGSISLEPVVEDGVIPASQGRSRSATTSRFSADSITIVGEEGAASVKPSMKTTLMTVRSIKKLWRKSNNRSNSNNVSANVSGRNSPQVPPMRPERPSQETMDLPDVPVPTPPPNFKGFSPQPNPSLPLPPARMSQDQYKPSRTSQDQYILSRTSHDQTNGPSAHVPQSMSVPPHSKQGLQVPQTPNQGGFPVPAPPTNQGGYSASAPSPNHLQGLMVPPQTHQGLGPPSFAGRNGNASPIIAAQMLPGRGGSSLDKFRFDQESPYPVHVSSSPRYSPRAVSPPSLPPAQTPFPSQTNHGLTQTQASQPLPPLPEKDKPVARKSILKAFQKAPKTPPVSSSTPIPTEPRPSFDKLSHASSVGRPRRPSSHSTKSSTNSVNDIPPSPQIPDQFFSVSGPKNGPILTPGPTGDDNRGSVGSGLTASSTEPGVSQRQDAGRSASPPPKSMASSRSSQETRPSFDVSQFEIVSPKTSTLTYPYHGLDHQ